MTVDGFLSRLSAPAFPFVGASILIALTLGFATVARRTDVGATRMEQPTAVASIDLMFDDRPDGGILVTDVTGASPPIVVPPGDDGFVRVALQGLARDRRATGAAKHVPFRLGRQADGGLFLRDLATDRVLMLDAYGHANAKSFAQFLTPRRSTQ